MTELTPFKSHMILKHTPFVLKGRMEFPDHTLSTFDLMEMMSHVKEFAGVFSRDRVPRILHMGRPTCFIINLDDHNGPGTHWVALYHSPKSKYIDYFDSFGLPPPTEIQRYKSYKPIQFNDGVLQDLKSSACGYYCVHFLRARSQGVSYAVILKKFREGEGAYNERVLMSKA